MFVNKKHLPVIFLLITTFWLSSCSGEVIPVTVTHTSLPTQIIVTDSPIPTTIPSATETATLTPFPTDTPTQTPTPTEQYFGSIYTPIPTILPVISVINAQNVSSLKEWSVENLTDLVWTPDGSSLAAATVDSIHLFDVYSGELWRSLYPEFTGYRKLAYSPSGQWLISGSRSGSEETGYITNMERWYGLDMMPLGLFDTELRGLSDMEFTANNLILFTAYASSLRLENSIEFWDTRTWVITNTMQADLVLDISVSNIGDRLATTPDFYAINIWDLNATGKPLFTIQTAFSNAVTTASFSPNGSYLATAHYDGAIKLWDVVTGVMIREINSGAAVQSLAFSPDGTLLASGNSYENHLIKLWWVDTGDLLRSLEGHSSGVDHLLFSPYGDLLVSGSYDGTILLWGIRP